MDRFATAVLMGVLEDLRRPSSFLLDTFFPGVFESDTEEIHFDVLTNKRRITPLVHPTRAGKIVDNKSYAAKTFKPAYAKDKRRWDPTAPLKRMAGERIGGQLTAAQRLDALVSQALADQLEMLTMREEVMASEALRTGTVTIAGEGYEPVVVDFERAGTHTDQLTDTDCWDVAADTSTADPLNDIETRSGLCQQDAGGIGRVVVMSPDAWKNMKRRLGEKGQLRQLFDYSRSGNANVQLGPLTDSNGGRYVGSIGQFDFWVYDQTYVDDNGATQHLMPSGTVIMGDQSIEGVRAYGAILDPKANYKATRYFAKSWEEEDPAVRWMMLQSAPLIVPTRPNASVCFNVLTPAE